jgi:hypothetical protein
MSNLMSIKEVEMCITAAMMGNFSQGCQMALARQLADTMRELDALKIENDENRRIIGMSGEAEAALKNKNEILREALKYISEESMDETVGIVSDEALAAEALVSCKDTVSEPVFISRIMTGEVTLHDPSKP